MAKITPYVTYDNDCREAFEFYHSCLGGELDLRPIEGSPMAAHMPSESHKYIMHAALVVGDLTLFGSDMFRKDEGLHRGNDIAISYTGTVEEVKTAFAKLSEGGTVDDELREEFFGTYGSFHDKFGVRWMVQADAAPQPAN